MDDDEGPTLSRKKKKQKKQGAWLLEKGDEEIVDFLDPSAAKQVISKLSVEFKDIFSILPKFLFLTKPDKKNSRKINKNTNNNNLKENNQF